MYSFQVSFFVHISIDLSIHLQLDSDNKYDDEKIETHFIRGLFGSLTEYFNSKYYLMYTSRHNNVVLSAQMCERYFMCEHGEFTKQPNGGMLTIEINYVQF